MLLREFRVWTACFLLLLFLAGTVAIKSSVQGGNAPSARTPAAKKPSDLTIDRIPKDLKIEDNVVYKTVGGQALKLIVFYPKVRKYDRAPVLIYIHGGGWVGGNRFAVISAGGIDVVRQLNEAGVVCASIDYRLLPLGPHSPPIGSPGRPTTLDQEADCRDALHFFAKNAARFGIDPLRMGTMGASAGGHLSLVTALGEDQDYPCDPALAKFTNYKILAEAADFPLVSLVDAAMFEGGFLARSAYINAFIGGPVTEHRDAAEKLSPTLLLKPDSPPILLVHGDGDRTLGVQNSVSFAVLCQQKGVPVELIVVKNADHSFRLVSAATAIDPSQAEINQRTAAFLLQYLLPRAK